MSGETEYVKEFTCVKCSRKFLSSVDIIAHCSAVDREKEDCFAGRVINVRLVYL